MPSLSEMSLEWASNPQIWIGLLTLTVLEVVLGIDNIIFISILSGKLPADQRPRARKLGLMVALISRILLLLSLGWVMSLTKPFAHLGPVELTGRSLILLLGGLFLIAKSVHEIHDKLEGEHEEGRRAQVAGFASVIVQIMILDVVFSLDSVITAVGMVNEIPVMIAAVVIAILVMIAFANPIGEFVERHPTVKMLALAFLILIGCNLIAEGIEQPIPKGYTYFAMAFATLVELLNIKIRGGTPVKLKEPSVADLPAE